MRSSEAAHWLAGTALLALVLILLAGCGGAKQSPVGSSHPIVPGDKALPWPPADSARVVSDDIAVLNGSDAALTGGHAVAAGSDLIMNEVSGLAWAIYSMGGFEGSTGEGYVRVAFSVSPPAPHSVYVAVADYSTNRWDWQEATAPEILLDLADISDYISPGGSLHAAVLQQGTSNLTVSQVTIARLGLLPPAPTGLAAAPEGFGLRLSWDPVPYASGYKLYRAGNPGMSQALDLTPQPVADPTLVDPDVIAFDTYYYAVSAIRGDESPRSAVLQAEGPPEVLEAPANLTATADVGVAHLSWDPVPDAKTYVIYRALTPDFASPEQLQASPSTPQYDDAALAWDKVYYYKVAAKRNTEGPLSAIVDIHVPAADLPAPENLRVDSLVGDTVVMAWDYSFGGSYDGYKIYFSTTPDFNFDGPFYNSKQINDPGARSYTLSNLPPLTQLYCRVAAFKAVGRGRATDDVPFQATAGWTFGPTELAASGQGAISAIGLPGKIALGYFDGSAVQFGLRDGGSWQTEPVGLDENDAVNGFGIYIDIAESAGRYCVAAFSMSTGDLWAAVGEPGSWDGQLVHGDGSAEMHHPVSGINVKAVSAGGKFGLLHAAYVSGGDQLLFHSSDASTVSWSSGDAVATATFNPAHFSLGSDGSNFYALRLDLPNVGLFLGDQTGAWSWQDVSGGLDQGAWNDIQPYAGGWLSPALDSSRKILKSFEGVDGSAGWTSKDITTGSEVSYVHLAVDGPLAMVIYQTQTSPTRWYYSAYNGDTWGGAAILLPGVNPSRNADLVFMDGVPYFIFEDTISGQILAAPGSPPV